MTVKVVFIVVAVFCGIVRGVVSFTVPTTHSIKALKHHVFTEFVLCQNTKLDYRNNNVCSRNRGGSKMKLSRLFNHDENSCHDSENNNGIEEKTHPLNVQNNNYEQNDTSNKNINRRKMIVQTTSEMTLGTFLLQTLWSSTSTTSSSQQQQSVPNMMGVASAVETPTTTALPPVRTIVITGANSGIGLDACKRLAVVPNTIIVLACRTYEKAVRAIEQITTTTTNEGLQVQATLVPKECDLSNLQSIRTFVSNLITTTPTETSSSSPSLADAATPATPPIIRTIDVLALNAGIALDINNKECYRTKDGFELTMGTNHFGHFYLNALLLPYITNSIVVTASSVHDPNSPGGSQGETATLGTMMGLEQDGRNCEMIDGQSYNADKAYKDSKLCNVLFTRELQRRIDQAAINDKKYTTLVANCFTPGLIVGSGLFRNQNPFFTKLFDVAATNILKVGETIEWGGAALTYMITNVTGPTVRGQYYYSKPGSSSTYGEERAFQKGDLNVFGPTQVSIEAQDNNKAKRLWELSEQLLEIKTII